MLIITTIYSMELETAKKLGEKQDAEEQAVTLPGNEREFLGIYQGKGRVERREE